MRFTLASVKQEFVLSAEPGIGLRRAIRQRNLHTDFTSLHFQLRP
jgi:hypothetical protein